MNGDRLIELDGKVYRILRDKTCPDCCFHIKEAKIGECSCRCLDTQPDCIPCMDFGITSGEKMGCFEEYQPQPSAKPDKNLEILNSLTVGHSNWREKVRERKDKI